MHDGTNEGSGDPLRPPSPDDGAAASSPYALVEVASRETVFQNYFRIDRWRLRHRKFDGGWSEVMTREVFERGQAVAVVLYDPSRDALVLIEQFRVGPFAAHATGQVCEPQGPWMLEIVAGIVDPGETAEQVARREAEEEAGCQVADIEFLFRIFASPGGTTETISVFFARVAAPETGAVHGLDHEHEDIRVLVLRPEEVYALIDEGRITNGPCLAALLWFRVNEARLRRG